MASTTKSPNSDFDSSSQVWKQIRARANVTAEEPFAAEGPPSVVYTTQTASATGRRVLWLFGWRSKPFGGLWAGSLVAFRPRPR